MDLLPKHTRLRYVTARKKQDIVQFLQLLGKRVQIYSIQKDGQRWVLWFVPDDRGADVASVDL